MDKHNYFHGIFLWTLDASMGKQGENILLCTDNCVTQLQDVQFRKQANLCFTHHTALPKD